MEFNNYEFSCEQKIKGGMKLRAIMFILLYVIYVIAFFSLILALRIVPLGAFIPVTLFAIIFFTWRYVKADNTYAIQSGVLTVLRRYGSGKPKELISFKVKDALAIAPYRERSSFDIDRFAPNTVIDIRPYKGCDGEYYLLYRDAKGKKVVLYFKATEEALKILQFYNDRMKSADH